MFNSFKKMFIILITLSFILIPSAIVSGNDKNSTEDVKIYLNNNPIPLFFSTGEPFTIGRDIYVPLNETMEQIKWSKDMFFQIDDVQYRNNIAYIPICSVLENSDYYCVSSVNDLRIFDKPQNGLSAPKFLQPNVFTPYSDNVSFLSSNPAYSLDENGIFVYNYASNYNEAGNQYNPAFISLYAFALYRDYLESGLTDQTLKEQFLSQADWLVANRKDVDDFSIWEYHFDNEKFGAYAPWRSAMANGRVISVMLEAYSLTNDMKYLEIAEKAYRAFLKDTTESGVATFLENGSAYYEEVADHEAESSKILNGHVFALSGLYDYWIATGRHDVYQALYKGISAVRNDLEKFDAGFLSYYSQGPENPRILAERGGYNTLHISQMLWLYELSNDAAFLKKAIRFMGYDTNEYKITSKGSTDPIGHGPDKLDLRLGLNYWSHNSFPTWVVIDMGRTKPVTEIVVLGHTENSSPKDFDVSYSNDNKNWNIIEQISDNKDKVRHVKLNDSIAARYIKVDIYSDNGNKNVALDGIGIVSPENPDIITDFGNFSASNFPTKALDGQFSSKFIVKNDGWIIIDLGEDHALTNEILIHSGIKAGIDSTVNVFGSNDLSNWYFVSKQTINNASYSLQLKDNGYRYIKIYIPKSLEWISEFTLKKD